MTRMALVTVDRPRRKRLPLTAPRKADAPVAAPAPLKQAEAAALLGISREYLSRLTSGGDVPHHKLGNRPRYFADELLDWLRTR